MAAQSALAAVGSPDAVTVVGGYLYPFRIWGKANVPSDPGHLARIVGTLTLDGLEMTLTGAGGIFTIPPKDAWDGDAQRAFEQSITGVLNLLVCELALNGGVWNLFQTFIPQYVVPAKLRGDYALVLGGGGAGPLNTERQMGPATAMFSGTVYMTWPHSSTEPLEQAAALVRSRCLRDIAASLPVLVADAYWNFSAHAFSSAQANAWIVTERLLNFRWDEYVGSLADTKRKRRLNDNRTYSAAVKTETLLAVGRISPELHALLEDARTQRNALMHSTIVSEAGALAAMLAMHGILESVLGVPVHPPGVAHSRMVWL